MISKTQLSTQPTHYTPQGNVRQKDGSKSNVDLCFSNLDDSFESCVETLLELPTDKRNEVFDEVGFDRMGVTYSIESLCTKQDKLIIKKALEFQLAHFFYGNSEESTKVDKQRRANELCRLLNERESLTMPKSSYELKDNGVTQATAENKQRRANELCRLLNERESLMMPKGSYELKDNGVTQATAEKIIEKLLNKRRPKSLDLLIEISKFNKGLFYFAKKCIPLIGVSQSGKSTLFHELVETNSTDRIGNGSESKSCLCIQKPFTDEYSFVDTPGLMDTRSEEFRVFTQYQLSELMVSGQFPTIVVTLTEKDFLPPFTTTNGIRALMMFFDRFFDLRLMNGGFYESILNDYLGTEDYSGMLTTLDASRELDAQSPEQDILVEGAREGIKQTWNDCLDAIGAAIESMPSTPFTVFVRDNESDLDEDEQLTPKKLDRNISRYINRLKTHILEQVLTNYGIISPEIDDLMGCLIYIFTIKKNVTVTNSMDSKAKRAQVGASLTVPFDFEAIRRTDPYLDSNQRRIIKGVIDDFNHRLQDRIRIHSEIKDQLNYVKLEKKAVFKSDQKLEKGGAIFDLERVYLQQKKKLEDEKVILKTQLNELDTDEMVDKRDFPINGTARFFGLWSYIEFTLPEGVDKDDVEIKCEDRTLVEITTKYYGSKIVVQYPFWFNTGAMVERRPIHKRSEELTRKRLSYTATLHCYESKKLQKKDQIETIKKRIESIDELVKKYQSSIDNANELTERLIFFNEQSQALNELTQKLIDASASINEVKGAMDMMSDALKSGNFTWLNQLIHTDTKEKFNRLYATLDVEDPELIDWSLGKLAVQHLSTLQDLSTLIEQTNKELNCSNQATYVHEQVTTLGGGEYNELRIGTSVFTKPVKAIPRPLILALQTDLSSEDDTFEFLENDTLKRDYELRQDNVTARQAVLRLYFINEIQKKIPNLTYYTQTLLYHAKLSYLRNLCEDENNVYLKG